MRPTTLIKNRTLYWTIRLYNSTGGLVDADSTPTVAVRKNGASTADAVTVSKRSATTGIYDCSYNPASEVEGDQFTIEESATIGSTVYANSFEVCVREPERGTDNASTHAAPDLSNLDVAVSSRSSHAAPDLSNLDVAVSTRSSHDAPDLSNLDAAVSSRSSHAAPDLSNLDAAVSSRQPSGNVTVGDLSQAALAKFANTATGESSATAGSVADLSKGSGGSGSGGDATLAKQNEILGKFAETPVNVINNVSSGGEITIYLGDDDTGSNAIQIPHNGGSALRTKLQAATSVIFGAGTGDAANQITGTINQGDITDTIIPVEIPSANKVGAPIGDDYTWHVKAITSGAEHVESEGALNLRAERAQP